MGTRAKIDSLQANLLGMLQLLLSAETSLQARCPDEQCQSILAACISEFQARHKIAMSEACNFMVWREQGVVPLLRLLLYAIEEARGTIRDETCAEQLARCARRLFEVCGLSPESLYSGTRTQRLN